MTVRWLVEPKRGLCFWTSMQMLMHYHRLRLGLPVPGYTEFDDWVDSGAPAPMMRRELVQPLIERHGLRWGYVSLKEQHLERLLSKYGPVMYICKLYPNSDIEHTVVITGIELGPRGRVVIFNDPGSGGEGRLPFARLVQEHPPMFKATEGGVTKSAFVFHSRKTPAPLRILRHKKAALSPTPRRTTYSDVFTRKTYQVNTVGGHMRTGSQKRLAKQYGTKSITQTFQARYNPLHEAVRRLRAGPLTTARKPDLATKRWLRGLAKRYGTHSITQTFQARYDPLHEAVRKLRTGRPAMAHKPEPATKRWLQGLTKQYGARSTRQTFQARYNPLQRAVHRLRG